MRAALVGLRRSAATNSISTRIREMRESGTLPPATRVAHEKTDSAAPAHIPTEAVKATARQHQADAEPQKQGQEKTGGLAAADTIKAGDIPHSETTVPNSHKDTNSGNSEQCCATTEPQTQGQEKVLFAPAFDFGAALALTDDDLEAMLLQVADDIEDELARDVAPDDAPDPDGSGGGSGAGRKGRLGGHHGHLMGLAAPPHIHHNTWRGGLAPPSPS